jgi:hypothetical protein
LRPKQKYVTASLSRSLLPMVEEISIIRRREAETISRYRLHNDTATLNSFFGSSLLTELTRESLTRYINNRMGETLIRRGKASKKPVIRGTVSNELSCLRRMLRVAAREGYMVSIPSFEDLIVRTKRGGRALSGDEQKSS